MGFTEINGTRAASNPFPLSIFALPIASMPAGTIPWRRRWPATALCGWELMKSAENRLTAMGFGGHRGAPEIWRVARLDRPKSSEEPWAGPEWSCSPELGRWRLLLARDRQPSAYRIARIVG